MVTLPTEAADNYSLVLDLINAGMQVARINCSHDNRQIWESMITNIKRARKELNGHCLIYMDLAGPKIRTGEVEEEIVKQGKKKKNKKKRKIRDFITLKQGDLLKLYANPVQARSARYKIEGETQTPATISITLPSALEHMHPNQRVMFDDGKIAGKVLEVFEDHVLISITRTDTKGGKLRGEKGINLPDTLLELPSLTEVDRENLLFIAGSADIIGYSFVRDPGDILELQAELEKLGRSDIGIVLKIETREAFENFPSIILTAMRSPSVGVMIARGDLAVELGAERISEVQEELLWLSDAAHVPNIWATQVLEKLAKEGIATRAEITDASMSARAECVMMNKGPFIVEAVKTLGNILERMEAHQYKKEGALRALHVAEHFIASL
jgi:pyruvate kinase